MTTAKKTTAKTAKPSNSRAQKGSGFYECRCCDRKTRATGGDGASVLLCELCYTLSGEENHYSDNGGTFYDSPARVLEMIEAVTAAGGNASCWTTLKAQAEALTAPALPPGVFGARVDGKRLASLTDAAHAIAFVEAEGSGLVYEYRGATRCLTWALHAGTWSLLDHTGKRLHDQRPS